MVTYHAQGTFDVQLAPLPLAHSAADASLGRMSIDKRFQGDLAGTSTGEMLSARAAVAGSAGYVAIEHVSGALHGHSGSFVLQHSSTMARGTPQQSITVVPDSGAGELAGLAGSMTITIADGVHRYEFVYTLGEQG